MFHPFPVQSEVYKSKTEERREDLINVKKLLIRRNNDNRGLIRLGLIRYGF